MSNNFEYFVNTSFIQRHRCRKFIMHLIWNNKMMCHYSTKIRRINMSIQTRAKLENRKQNLDIFLLACHWWKWTLVSCSDATSDLQYHSAVFALLFSCIQNWVWVLLRRNLHLLAPICHEISRSNADSWTFIKVHESMGRYIASCFTTALQHWKERQGCIHSRIIPYKNDLKWSPVMSAHCICEESS